MKNYLIPVLFTGSVLSACGPLTPQASSPAAPVVCYSQPDLENTSGLNLISYDHAKEISEYYAADRNKMYVSDKNGKITNIPDATSITFSFEQLKKYIALAEKAICEGPCDTIPELYMRFYYAKYPDTTRLREMQLNIENPEYAMHHTLFLIPALLSESGKLVEFNPQVDSINCENPPPVSTAANKPSFLSVDPGSGTDGSNHGGLRPPPYDVVPFTFPAGR